MAGHPSRWNDAFVKSRPVLSPSLSPSRLRWIREENRRPSSPDDLSARHRRVNTRVRRLSESRRSRADRWVIPGGDPAKTPDPVNQSSTPACKQGYRNTFATCNEGKPERYFNGNDSCVFPRHCRRLRHCTAISTRRTRTPRRVDRKWTGAAKGDNSTKGMLAIEDEN